MHNSLRHIVLVSVAMTWLIMAGNARETEGRGSATADNSHVVIPVGYTELRFSETSYFGPNARWEIHGTLEIWSKYIWIAPGASFTGTGRIIIHSPGANVYYDGWQDSPTYIDGNNGLPIEVTMEIRNPHQLHLANIDDPGYGTQPIADQRLSAALTVGKRLELAVDGAHVLLNGHDLQLGAAAEISNYGPERHVITGNSIAGHLVKTFVDLQPFVYPLGIAAGDYTPATLLPASSSVLAVSVQDYAAAQPALANPRAGMDRLWHTVADRGVQATYTLQHNTITNGQTYVDESAEIVQYAGGTNWLGGNTHREAEGIHRRDGITVAHEPADVGSWLTKLLALQAPQAAADVAEVESGARVDILVLENDRPGSSPIILSGLRVSQQPVHGTAYVNRDGSISYSANAGFVGTDSFTYRIEDENGMTSEATVTVTVIPRPLRIPNVFTPNNDGQNDYFEIQGLEGVDRVELTVINRWGNEVYRSREYRNDWNGGNLAEGTYFYEVVAHKNSEGKRYSGWVLLKRR